MRTKPRATVLLVAAVLVFVVLWWELPRFRLSAAQKKYPLGMTLQEARLRLRQPYYVSTNTDLSIHPLDPQGQHRPYPFPVVRAVKDGLYLEFDHEAKLSQINLLETVK